MAVEVETEALQVGDLVLGELGGTVLMQGEHAVLVGTDAVGHRLGDVVRTRLPVDPGALQEARKPNSFTTESAEKPAEPNRKTTNSPMGTTDCGKWAEASGGGRTVQGTG